MTGNLAAIWWRTSTKAQLEISPETQIQEARRALEAKGCMIPDEYILGADWTSMDLMGCSEFQELRRLVDERKVRAVGMLDRDRLQAKGLQRLMFMSDCKERATEIVVAQGAEFVDGPEGQIVELALALGKERANLRAQVGSKMGLRDRVKLKGLPITRHAPYGYAFNKTMDTLEPTGDWTVLERVLEWALEGISLRGISRRLFEMGIPSPMGRPTWSPITVSRIVANPAYAGRYHALKGEAVEPDKRRGNTYGKSSKRWKSEEEWVYMPSIRVVDPPISWEEHLEIRRRLERNRINSKRNTKWLYLLRGMIRCGIHDKAYQGCRRNGSWAYRCSVKDGTKWNVKKCDAGELNGPRMETAVWNEVTRLLLNPELVRQEASKARQGESLTLEALERAEREANKRLRTSYDAEAHYARLSAQGELSDETRSRLLSEVKAQRIWATEEVKRIEQDRAALQAGLEAAAVLEKLLERVKGRLDTATWEEKRMVLEALDTQVMIGGQGCVELILHVPPDTAIASRDPTVACR